MDVAWGSQEMTSVAGIHSGQRQQHQQISRIELLIPGRFSADEGSETHVSFHQRRQDWFADEMARIRGISAVRDDSPVVGAETGISKA